jgi:RNA polymerase sigma-70 factor (ECF subfamily)
MLRARKAFMEDYMIHNREKLYKQNSEESELVSKAKQDPKSFGKLYDLHAPSIYRYVLSRIGNVQEAQDITSQTFLKALEMLPLYKHRGYFSAWLFSIARSKYIDHFRKHNQETRAFINKDLETEPDVLSTVVGRERLTILNDILRLLPEDEQDLLRLRNVAELSFTEIAEILKKNEGAIKKRYYRLLARLQSQLEEENEI